MNKTIRLAVLLVGAAIPPGAPPPAFAHVVRVWTYEELFKAADLVVIAQAEASADTDDVLQGPPDKQNYVGVNTRFKVLAALKGEASKPNFTFLHFRLKNQDSEPPNGPRLVAFHAEPVTLNTTDGKYGLGTPAYMLFLKLRSDGHYEAVTGQLEPVDAVRMMIAPLSREVFGK